MQLADSLPLSAVDQVATESIASVVAGLPPGRVSLLAGVTPGTLLRLLDKPAAQPQPSALFIDIPARDTAEDLIDGAVDALAEAARHMWPLWYGGEDFGTLDGSTLSRAALRIRLERLRARLPGLSTGWASAAMRLVNAGGSPRVGTAPQSEIVQLGLALGRPILVLPWQPGAAAPARAFVAAAEWLARTLDVPVLVLCADLPAGEPPFDRWPRRALALEPADAAAPTLPDAPTRPLLSTITGQPHPFSDCEKKLARWLSSDAELGPLFGFNQPVCTLQGRVHRVDLLCKTRRIVVEIDGYADHATRPKFRDDRHRDYELLVSGFRVLRITNEEVEDDCARVMEKIRDVVRSGR